MTTTVVFLLQGLLGTVLAPVLARRKGYPAREWFFIGLAMGVIAVPFAMCLKARPPDER